MKIALINNGTRHVADIMSSLNGHEIVEYDYDGKYIDIPRGYDVVLLSGSSTRDPEDLSTPYEEWFYQEKEMIERISQPIVGICMGFELICEALGNATRYKLPYKAEGPKRVIMNAYGAEVFGVDSVVVHEGHKHVIPSVDEKILKILASSSTGIEAVMHTNRPIIAVQFHPEVTKEPGLRSELLFAMVAAVTGRA
jgi:GMP synthase-like glutamine amidotransferase